MENSTFHNAFMLLVRPDEEKGAEYWCGQCNTWIGQPSKFQTILTRIEQHIEDEPSCGVLMQIANEEEVHAEL